ncbi:MAG: hypothetical protein EOO67_03255 [Microbacterium sp.]|nr:MAG: hypothetical protein EOO67_03255 [Microbacterium sp.]
MGAGLRPHRGGRRAAVLLGVFLVFGVETIVAAAIPLTASALGVGDAGFVGILLALTNGAGLLALPFLSRLFDDARRLAATTAAGALMAGGLLLMLAAAVGVPAPQLLLTAGVSLFGLGRILGVLSLLATIAGLPGDAPRQQGWNAASQRLGSGIALLLSIGLVSTGSWAAAFAALLVAVALWTLVARRTARPVPRTAAPREKSAASAPPLRPLVSAVACVAELRRPRVRAAGFLNVVILLVLVTGNSFAAMGAADSIDASQLGLLVTLSICVRDGCSVVVGISAGRLLRKLGERGSLVLVGLAAVGGVAMLAAMPSHTVAVIASAALHGAMVGLAIPLANLLASTGEVSEAPVGMRLASSQLPAAIALLTAPMLFGAILGASGATAAYLAVVAVIVGAGIVVFTAVRRR